MLRALVALLLLANLAFFAWARGWLGPGLPPPNAGQHEPQRLAGQVRPEAVVVLGAPAASAAVAAAVTAARTPASVCLEAGPLNEADLPAAEAALAAASPQGGPGGPGVTGGPGGPGSFWQRDAVPPPPLWLVVAGRWPDPGARRARQAEMRRAGIDTQVQALPAEGAPGPDSGLASNLLPGLVISRHGDRASAAAALAALPAAAALDAANLAATTATAESAASRPSAAAIRDTVREALRGLRVQQLPAPPARYLLRVAQADAPLQARLQAVPAAAVAGGFRACAVRQ